MISSISSVQASSVSSETLISTSQETDRALHEAELRQSAQDFEASYIAQMLTFSGLDKALMSGGGEDVAAFASFYIESFAEEIAEKGGFGLADNFYEQMLKMSGLSEIDSNEMNNGDVPHVDFGKL